MPIEDGGMNILNMLHVGLYLYLWHLTDSITRATYIYLIHTTEHLRVKSLAQGLSSGSWDLNPQPSKQSSNILATKLPLPF